ncbi:MAG: carbohydrate kinase family protein [Eubacteriales bacterium]|nr:carbohydrate kinase family protein [Eubacteriales bacterium]
MKDKILIVGAGIIDVLVQPVKADVFEKGSVPVENISITTGGDALNEATILARLGKKPLLVSLVGKDQAGTMVLDHCDKEGISTKYVTRDDTIPTGVNVVMVQEDGSRNFFTNPSGSLRKLSLDHIPSSFPEDVGILCFASIFVSPMLDGKGLQVVFARAKDQGMIVCADMTKCKNQETVRDIHKALSMVDYLFANEEEAQLVTGADTPESMAQLFLDCGVKNVIIKRGGKGCYFRSQEGEAHIPAIPASVCVDTTGAGDAFAAGFLCALSENRDLSECIRWANACGSLTVETVGAVTGIKNREQVEARICE